MRKHDHMMTLVDAIHPPTANESRAFAQILKIARKCGLKQEEGYYPYKGHTICAIVWMLRYVATGEGGPADFPQDKISLQLEGQDPGWEASANQKMDQMARDGLEGRPAQKSADSARKMLHQMCCHFVRSYGEERIGTLLQKFLLELPRLFFPQPNFRRISGPREPIEPPMPIEVAQLMVGLCGVEAGSTLKMAGVPHFGIAACLPSGVTIVEANSENEERLRFYNEILDVDTRLTFLRRSIDGASIQPLEHDTLASDPQAPDRKYNYNFLDHEKFEYQIADPEADPKFDDNAHLDTVREAIARMKPNGRAIIRVDSPFLFIRPQPLSDLRCDIVKEELLESVIRLPSRLTPSATIGDILLVLARPVAPQRPVRFVDASDCWVEAAGGERGRLDVEAIRRLLDQERAGGCVAFGSSDEIARLDYELIPERYLQRDRLDVPEGHRRKQLKEILVKIPSKMPDDRQDGVYLRTAEVFQPGTNLEPVGMESLFSIQAPEFLRWRRHNEMPRVVEEDCIIIGTAIASRALRVGWFKYRGKGLFLTGGMSAFKVKKKLVDTQWLVSALSSPAFQESVRTLVEGNFPSVDPFRLLGMELAVPDTLEKQRLLVHEYKKTLDQSKTRELEFEKELADIKASFFSEMALKRHSLSQVLLQISSSVANLSAKLKQKGQLTEGDIVSSRRQVNFRDYLASIEEDCQRMGRLLKALTEELEFEGSSSFCVEKART